MELERDVTNESFTAMIMFIKVIEKLLVLEEE